VKKAVLLDDVDGGGDVEIDTGMILGPVCVCVCVCIATGMTFACVRVAMLAPWICALETFDTLDKCDTRDTWESSAECGGSSPSASGGGGGKSFGGGSGGGISLDLRGGGNTEGTCCCCRGTSGLSGIASSGEKYDDGCPCTAEAVLHAEKRDVRSGPCGRSAMDASEKRESPWNEVASEKRECPWNDVASENRECPWKEVASEKRDDGSGEKPREGGGSDTSEDGGNSPDSDTDIELSCTCGSSSRVSSSCNAIPASSRIGFFLSSTSGVRPVPPSLTSVRTSSHSGLFVIGYAGSGVRTPTSAAERAGG
jgi:hypothetical protein